VRREGNRKGGKNEVSLERVDAEEAEVGRERKTNSCELEGRICRIHLSSRQSSLARVGPSKYNTQKEKEREEKVSSYFADSRRGNEAEAHLRFLDLVVSKTLSPGVSGLSNKATRTPARFTFPKLR